MEKSHVRTINIDGISLILAKEYEQTVNWIGSPLAVKQLKAAWMRLSDDDIPMNARLIGKPGVGKTTLAIAVAQMLGLKVFLMQATSDTRPEDLIITPVIGDDKRISYVASPLTTAVILGGVCVLDEGNRMSEKSWASLTALLDHRRYVDSLVTGLRISAHENFSFVTTTNEDSSVYDLPEYIQSRLNPQIYVDFADMDAEKKILKMSVPYVNEQLLNILLQFLHVSHNNGEPWSVRDGIQIAKYASRMIKMDQSLSVENALYQAMFAILGPDNVNKYFPPEPYNNRLRPV